MKLFWIIMLFFLMLSLAGCNLLRLPQTPDRPFSYEINVGVDTIFEGDDWEDKGVLFTLDGDEHVVYADVDEIDFSSYGIVQVSYHFTVDGTIYTIKRLVTILPPVIHHIPLAPGIDTVLVGESWEDAGLQEEYLHETFEKQVIGEVDVNTPGDYQIEYRLTDFFGNTRVIIRHVTVLP